MRDKTPARERIAQRKTTTRQRVNPLTLGDLQRGGVQQVECECGWCRHDGVIELEPLIARAGAAAFYRDVAQHFCCSVCGWRGVSARPIWPNGKNYKRPKVKAPSLPSMEECRAVLTATRVDPNAQTIENRGAYVRALQQRWPELTALAALFVVQQLHPQS
jgi:hypothetical protein